MAERLSKQDYRTVAEFVLAEYTRRKGDPRRKHLEKVWAEVDRQVAMEGKGRVKRDGSGADEWRPQIELPDQAAALEIISADVRRLLFGPDDYWFSAHAVTTDKYLAKLREQGSMIAGIEGDVPFGIADQDGADQIVHATLTQFHKLYDHRAHWVMMMVEGLKRGTYAGRVDLVELQRFTPEYRGAHGNRKIPMIIPLSMKNLFLDDAQQNVMLEGMAIAPATIRRWWQYPGDIRKAASLGGRDQGWYPEGVKQMLESVAKNDKLPKHVEVIEMEGDIYIPRSRDDVFKENHRVTVVVDGGPTVVRMRENPLPFRSTVVGYYQRDDVEFPYGTSPLFKGRPIQEAMSEAANQMMASAILSTDPPVSYAADEAEAVANGGLTIEPGAQWQLMRPDKVKPHQIGDPNALFNITSGLSQRYDELTSTSQPRQSGQIKSHTTAEGNLLAHSRSVLATEDFGEDVKLGPLTTWLYMEHELAKRALSTPLTVLVKDSKGHIEVTRAHWPDMCNFSIRGALGTIEEQREAQRLVQAAQAVAQLETIKLQSGGAPTDWQKVQKRLWEVYNIPNAEEFEPNSSSDTSQSPGEAGISGVVGGTDAFGAA